MLRCARCAGYVLKCLLSPDVRQLAGTPCRACCPFVKPCSARCAGYVLKCLLSPDVRQLATTSSDKTVKLWNLDGFTLDRTLTGTRRCAGK